MADGKTERIVDPETELKLLEDALWKAKGCMLIGGLLLLVAGVILADPSLSNVDTTPAPIPLTAGATLIFVLLLLWLVRPTTSAAKS